jgi:restriction system protein
VVRVRGARVARRRGFFAEIQHQQRLADARTARVRRERAAAAAAVERARAQTERARLQAVRATAANARATEAERKRAEREAQAAYGEARKAEVDDQNEALRLANESIAGLLSATLEVDDYVDLEQLKRSVEHPPFPHPDLERAVPRPLPLVLPPAPVWEEPPAPKGMFGKRKKHDELKQEWWAGFQRATAEWEGLRDALPQRQSEADRQYELLDQRRRDQLAAERRRYDAACRVREKDVEEHNGEIDALIAGLGYGVPDAVQEYLDIVLANSVYPEDFEVRHEATFDADAAEARIRAVVPAPDELPAAKAYRWVKASDEIVATASTKKDQADRYSDAIAQVALRTLHEVFEADRRGIIRSIALEVGPATKDPATGLDRFFPLVAVGASRVRFMEFDLSSVVPAATLQLGAAVSKSPLTLTVVDAGGVRRS